MSIKLIENEIRRFLSSDEPEVICISGHWGVGKTFAWNRYLKDALAEKGGIALKRYSYVSLFGVNSLDELRYSIFENSVKSSEVGVEPSLETLQSNTAAAAERLGRKSLWFLQQLPLIKNYVGGLGPVWFLSIKKTIVCVDDIERRGDRLPIRDVLGLISNLKEHKGCKVCLILNDEAMEEDEEDFQRYFEKIVDVSLKFSPSAEECARIAIDAKTNTERQLADCCVTLGISNIRLIKRIERLVRRIEPMLKEFDEQVLKQAIQSLSLFAWSVYEPDKAPALDYLQKRRGPDPFGVDEGAVPEKEAAWNAMLDAYGFAAFDEFDAVLLEGITNGFFDSSLVEKHAKELDSQIKAAKLSGSYLAAWNMFHDSFDENQQQVLDAIYETSLGNIQNIDLLNLQGTVTLLKELGRPDQAAVVLQRYISSHSEDRNLFDLRRFPFAGELKDLDIIRAFNDKYATFPEERTPVDVLQSMADRNGWSSDDITTLSALPIDEYYKIFKQFKGNELRRFMDVCLQFDRIGNATQEMKEIPKRAREALGRIGQESAINAKRVKRYGVNVKNEGPERS